MSEELREEMFRSVADELTPPTNAPQKGDNKLTLLAKLLKIAAGTLSGSMKLLDGAGVNLGNLKEANTSRTTATIVLAVQHVDAAGNVLNLDAANTARTTATKVLPVQPADAAANPGLKLTGTQRTPAASVVTADGTVAAGAKSVALIPSTDFVGTILGVDVGTQPLSFDAPPGDTLGAIAYTRSAGSLTILTLT